MEKELYPEYSFGDGEHPPSLKFNNILKIAEETRKFIGPFSISKITATGVQYQPTISSYWLQLDDDPWVVGGVSFAPTVTGTIRRFTIFYNSGDISGIYSSGGFARWDDITFTSGTIESATYWYVKITTGTKVFGGLDSLLSVNISGFHCYRQSG